MNVHPRLEWKAIEKTVREQTRAKHARLDAAFDRVYALLDELQGKPHKGVSEKESNVIQLFSR